MSVLKHSAKAEYSSDYIKGVLYGLKVVSIYVGDKKPLNVEDIEAEIEDVKTWPIKTDEAPEQKPSVKIELGEKVELLNDVNSKLMIARKLAEELTEALNALPLQQRSITGRPVGPQSLNDAFMHKDFGK